MNNRDFLLKKYKHKIIPGEKSVEELIDYLKGKVDIVEIATSELIPSIFQYIKFNVVNCMRNHDLNLTASDLNLLAYKLIKNNNNTSYYQEFKHISNDYEYDIIYVVFEKRTGYINSNCNKLLLELFIEQGISQYDYDHDTILLTGYISYLHKYSYGEY